MKMKVAAGLIRQSRKELRAARRAIAKAARRLDADPAAAIELVTLIHRDIFRARKVALKMAMESP